MRVASSHQAQEEHQGAVQYIDCVVVK